MIWAQSTELDQQVLKKYYVLSVILKDKGNFILSLVIVDSRANYAHQTCFLPNPQRGAALQTFWGSCCWVACCCCCITLGMAAEGS